MCLCFIKYDKGDAMSEKNFKGIVTGDSALGLANLKPTSGVQQKNAGGLGAFKPKAPQGNSPAPKGANPKR